MKILVGLKGPGLTELLHGGVQISSKHNLVIHAQAGSVAAPEGVSLSARAIGKNIVFNSSGSKNFSKTVPSEARISADSQLIVVLTTNNKQLHSGKYQGEVVLRANQDRLMVLLQSDLETYVQGVLRSEIPSAYHVEAMKAQAILARSYALHPRIDHSVDGFNVCDSFLCCQAFNGIDPLLTSSQRQAILATSGQILTYQGRPALALFSASAGGHTEDYSNCFSNLKTNQFPDNPVPYLKGIPEGKLPSDFPRESGMRALWSAPDPDTVDAWSPSFKWKVQFTADTLEAHMHHVIDNLLKDKQFAPFIAPPPGEKFGHIQQLTVNKRGVSGVAMELTIKTSAGDWIVKKELAIRSVFGNPDLKLKRLRSGRVFFDQQHDKLGLLASLTVSGLGFGHGVGLQQTGAQGLALRGVSCEKMLERYYPGATIASIDQLRSQLPIDALK